MTIFTRCYSLPKVSSQGQASSAPRFIPPRAWIQYTEPVLLEKDCRVSSSGPTISAIQYTGNCRTPLAIDSAGMTPNLEQRVCLYVFKYFEYLPLALYTDYHPIAQLSAGKPTRNIITYTYYVYVLARPRKASKKDSPSHHHHANDEPTEPSRTTLNAIHTSPLPIDREDGPPQSLTI